MIKQKRSKVKQAVLPFVLERTYETIPAGRQAGTGRDATAISGQKEDEWKPYENRHIAETVHCMEKTNQAFRLW
ncbi:MAG: hypothetical protein KIIPBIDF_00649 [Candidatus Methanoperedenaceae archaeon GB50]|nr:hypothetical protein BLFGPEAP_00503 [Candidatus Methanoperedenaceae archaeon GB50]CAD7775147.1 MAG: hypothetical protein KIIPBIDF_00649 [Candidatus Methanoperedenaceae archaeon GB50]